MNERLLYIRSQWKRTSIQLDFLQRIWESLDDEYQLIQNQILQLLISKLTSIISRLDKCRLPWKYVFLKQHLDEAIAELASWQKLYDPSWFLILRISSPFVDQELSRKKVATEPLLLSVHKLRDALRPDAEQRASVFLPLDGLENAKIRDIPFGSTRLIRPAGSKKWRVLDTMHYNINADLSLVTKDVRGLATKLISVDPFTFGVLQCHGVIRKLNPSTGRPASFEFVFKIPNELSDAPRSLRSYLCSYTNLTLTKRCSVARYLAKSISFIHTLGFVHKNLRPETILGFPAEGSFSDRFFLVGFENMRLADGRSGLQGDSAWERNLYRHPQRQGRYPEEVYSMQHDIYSLGVCLLEIGLWHSFVSYDGETLSPTVGLGLSIESPEFTRPVLMKDHLVRLAERELPNCIGERYYQVVVNCLTCLDQQNADFGDPKEFQDEDGVQIGVRYIEKVREN